LRKVGIIFSVSVQNKYISTISQKYFEKELTNPENGSNMFTLGHMAMKWMTNLGDQIGRTFAQWAIVSLGSFSKMKEKARSFLATFWGCKS
jgi:hypothetical protein